MRREGGRERGKEGRRERRREGGREGGREEGKEGGREEEREKGREGEREGGREREGRKGEGERGDEEGCKSKYLYPQLQHKTQLACPLTYTSHPCPYMYMYTVHCTCVHALYPIFEDYLWLF